jgi:hypothetical protein
MQTYKQTWIVYEGANASSSDRPLTYSFAISQQVSTSRPISTNYTNHAPNSISILLTALPLLTSATPLALPSTPDLPSPFWPTTTTNPNSCTPSTCLNPRSAQYIITSFISLLTNYTNTTADTMLTDDVVDTSDSINWLSGQPLGGVTFANKLAFELGQGSQPAIGVEVLGVDAVGCGTVVFRWAASIAPRLEKVKGIVSTPSIHPSFDE